ncbi:unnamed protein product [Peronospora effusa]|nr:unnamed protein product [Peronospora effusa]
MEIQLNAATEDEDMEETAPGLLHAVRMSSLLSGDVDTPQNAPHPPRSVRTPKLSKMKLTIMSKWKKKAVRVKNAHATDD